MGIVGSILLGVGGLGALVCFILVLVQMFKRGQTGLGIACIVLIFCSGLGELIAFIYGWVKSGEWGLKNVMIAWTVCLILIFIGGYMAQSYFLGQLQQLLPRP